MQHRGATSWRCAFGAVDIWRWSAALRDQVVVTGCPPALAALQRQLGATFVGSLLPWLANGFRALGAASTAGNVSLAALPFDARRNGMLLGDGAIGMVLETEAGFAHRQSLLPPLSSPLSSSSIPLLPLLFLFSPLYYYSCSC